VEPHHAHQQAYVRVAAGGRVFDLCYDRLRKGWFLERALN
jgi:hypothetical protein